MLAWIAGLILSNHDVDLSEFFWFLGGLVFLVLGLIGVQLKAMLRLNIVSSSYWRGENYL